MPIKGVLCLLVASAALWGQTNTAQINGNVRDVSGLAVPDAAVLATQTATGATRTTTTGADGTFILPDLPVGPYTLEITKTGFAKYVQTGIALQVDSNPAIEASLKVGSVSETVTVEAGAAMVETHSTGIGNVIDNQRVVELPLNGRDPTQLIFLSGMATPGTVPQLRNFPAASVSIAGGQGNGVSYLLDGAQHNDVASSLNLPLPFPDALQEFKVETSALPAQYGFHSAGAVNAVTKSGTNEFHGDLFDFIRNGDFNARSFFATSRDTLKQNQWGGTIGGPVLKNKLFFFAGFQGRETRSDPPASIAFIPTAAELAGNFSVAAGPGCNNGKQINLVTGPGGTPYPNDQIPLTQLSPISLKIASLLPPAPDQSCGKITYGLLSDSNQYDTVSRVDYQLTTKQSLFVRATTNVLTIPSTYNGTSPLTLNTNATSNRVYTLAIGHTYLIEPNIISSFRAQVSRTGIRRTPDSFFDWAGLGVNFTDVGSGKTINLTVGATGSGFTIGSVNGNPGNTATGPNPQFAEDLSWIQGNHQFGFGGQYIFQLMNYWSGLNSTGIGAYPGTGGTGLAMSDFLTGIGGGAFTWTQGSPYGFTNRQNYFALYAQDSWKVRKNLTLTYGLRYEPYLAVYSKFGQFMHFDDAQFLAGTKSSVFVNAPPGLSYPGDAYYTCGRSVECDRWGKFAPRAGLVWDPKGDGNMTIRVSYGIFNDRESVFSLNFIGQDQPFGNAITATNPTLANPWINQPGGNPFPISINQNLPFQTNANVVTHPLNLEPTYLQQWNFSIQRQLGSWLVTANYLGNHTTHLLTSNQDNYAVFLGTGPCSLTEVQGGKLVQVAQASCSTLANETFRRVTYLQNPLQGQYYHGIAAVDDGGTASYNALYLSALKRLSNGVSVQANYTWGHCIGDVFDTQTGAAGASVTAVPGNREYYRSNCGTSDTRQLFNLSVVAMAPAFSNRTLRLVATGWQISPIVRLTSAQEFSVTSNVDTAVSGQAGQTPNLINPSAIYPAHQSVTDWINASAFANPPTGSYGNLGLNNIKGPGYFTVDVSLVRAFKVRERMSLQIRAEAFNLPNRANFSTPVATLTSGNFGQINSTGTNPPRIIQLAGKFYF